MKRRDIIKMVGAGVFAPVVLSVNLPAHAQTSMVDVQGDPRIGDDPVCVDDCQPSPPGLCDDKPHKQEICHHPAQPGTDPFEICVAKPAVPAHLRLHGDTLGMCPK